MTFSNSKEIKAMIRSIERRETVILKDIYLLEDIQVYEEYGNIQIADYSKYYVPLSILTDIYDFYNYYYELDYDGDITPSRYIKGYRSSFIGDSKKNFINFLEELRDIMQDIEKINKYIEICKENKIF